MFRYKEDPFKSSLNIGKIQAKENMMEIQKYCVLSLSGGMDSSTLLLHLLEKGYNVIALSFDYGQKHRLELEKAKQLVEYILTESNINIKTALIRAKKNGWGLEHHTIKLEGLQPLLNSNLVEGGEDVPEGHYEQENMILTVVPNRNKIFSSISQAVALSIAKKFNTSCIIALGIHAGDHYIYDDCRKEFRDADFEAFQVGNRDSEKVEMYTPYLDFNKYDILLDGEKCCKELCLDFNEVYKRTNTSYKPIGIISSVYEDGEISYFSDYKSASSVERIEAFIKLGRPDPVQYADETGLVSWEIAKTHVETILNLFSK